MFQDKNEITSTRDHGPLAENITAASENLTSPSNATDKSTSWFQLVWAGLQYMVPQRAHWAAFPSPAAPLSVESDSLHVDSEATPATPLGLDRSDTDSQTDFPAVDGEARP